MAALVPFLLFGCSGGKTGKSDAGEKSKDVQVQTTGSEEQRKLAMAATAVPGVSVSAVFGADADKLMAFGLKELGKSADSLSLAGPVYKLSATAGKTPGPDGCYAILPVTSGSICFDEKISAPRFLVPTVVPGTSAVPKLGLGGEQENSSLLPKICKTADGLDAFCVFLCGKGRDLQNVFVEKPPVPARNETEKPIYVKPKEPAFESEAVVVLQPPLNVKSETSNDPLLALPYKIMTPVPAKQNSNLAEPIPVPGPGPGTATQADVETPTAQDTENEPPVVQVEEIVPPNAETPDSSDPSESTTIQLPPVQQTTAKPLLPDPNPQSDSSENFERITDRLKIDGYGRAPNPTPPPIVDPPAPVAPVTTEGTGGGRAVDDEPEAEIKDE